MSNHRGHDPRIHDRPERRAPGVLRHVPRFAREQTRDRPEREPTPAIIPTSDLRGTERPLAPSRGKATVRRSAAKIFRQVELESWLAREHGLDPQHARAVAERLLASTPRIRGAFQKWWLTGRVEDLEIAGYSLRRLVREKKMSVLGALLTLSLLESGRESGRGVTPEELDGRGPGELEIRDALERAEG